MAEICHHMVQRIAKKEKYMYIADMNCVSLYMYKHWIHRHLFHTWATLTNKTVWPMYETSACDWILRQMELYSYNDLINHTTNLIMIFINTR